MVVGSAPMDRARWNRVAAPADGTQPGRDRQGCDRRLRTGVWLCIWPRRRRRSSSARAPAQPAAGRSGESGTAAESEAGQRGAQAQAAGTRTGWRRRRARRAGRHRRLHDRAALRPAGARRRHGAGRVLRVPLQRRRHEVCRLKETAAKQEPLPPFALKDVKITINVDADYDIVQTRLTRNVVGIVEGSDPKLKDTYVLFGAHYDHIGYSADACRRTRRRGFGGGAGGAGGCTGQTRDTPRPGDIINNGADDDGSGTVAVMAIAQGVRAGTEAEAIADVRVARRRGSGPLRLALHGGLSRSCRSTRSRRS